MEEVLYTYDYLSSQSSKQIKSKLNDISEMQTKWNNQVSQYFQKAMWACSTFMVSRVGSFTPQIQLTYQVSSSALFVWWVVNSKTLCSDYNLQNSRWPPQSQRHSIKANMSCRTQLSIYLPFYSSSSFTVHPLWLLINFFDNINHHFLCFCYASPN